MDVLSLLYTLSGLIFGAAFIPQIKTLVKDQSGAVSLNLSTWATFAMCSIISLAYALTHTADHYFVFCSAIGVAGNLCVLTLGALRRLQHATVHAR